MGDDDSVEYIKVQTIGEPDSYIVAIDNSNSIFRGAISNSSVTAQADLANSKYIDSAIASSLNITGSHNIDALIDMVLPNHPEYVSLKEENDNLKFINDLLDDENKQLRDEIEKLNALVQPKINVNTVMGVKSPSYSVYKKETVDVDDSKEADEDDDVLTARKIMDALGRHANKAASYGTVTYDLEAMAEAVLDHDESRWVAEDSSLSAWSKFLKKNSTDDWGY